MGYTHYWYREEIIPATKFRAIRLDFAKVVLALDDMGVRLGNGLGEGVPEITNNVIVFNGLAACGHPVNSRISIPWPTSSAKGVAASSSQAESGNWFAGVSLESRCCDGDCSYETFALEHVFKPEFRQETDGKLFACTKTAFRPYDVAVTAALIIAKHHLGDAIQVSSDGKDVHWQDAKMLCYVHLGYGPELEIGEDGLQLRRAA